MASLDDLGRALRDDADASAPPASRIDVDAVISAARARRRPRQWAAGTLGLVAVLGLGGIAVGALAPPSLIAASESADSGSAGTAAPESVGADELLSEPGTARADGLLSCGAVPPAPGQGAVELAAEAVLPSEGDAGAVLTGTLQLINLGTEPRPVITAREAEAVVLLDGIVVGEATVVDEATQTAIIDPGVSVDLPVRISTIACVDGGALPPGDYTVLVLAGTWVSPDEPPTLAIAPESSLRLD
ncbi:MAG: hypothetical protein K2X36_06875 [Microbacteriaceae bacterium]|nr:hypothetical protein [Microbacteriaceae bacterium]